MMIFLLMLASIGKKAVLIIKNAFPDSFQDCRETATSDNQFHGKAPLCAEITKTPTGPAAFPPFRHRLF
jgi:hypothetical protein